MNKEKLQTLKKIFEEATEIVKELPEVFRIKAFEIVVRVLLEESEGLKKKEVKIQLPEDKEKREDKLDVLAQELKIDDKKALQTVYNFSTGGKINLTARLEGKNSEVQREVAYLYLLVKLIYGEQEWVSALELAKQITRYGVDDGHVAVNLEKEKGKILCAGSRKGKKYGLSLAGIQEAKTILNGLLSV